MFVTIITCFISCSYAMSFFLFQIYFGLSFMKCYSWRIFTTNTLVWKYGIKVPIYVSWFLINNIDFFQQTNGTITDHTPSKLPEPKLPKLKKKDVIKDVDFTKIDEHARKVNIITRSTHTRTRAHMRGTERSRETCKTKQKNTHLNTETDTFNIKRRIKTWISIFPIFYLKSENKTESKLK